VDDFQPHSGPQTGKTLVTVFGTKFVNNGQTFLRFINIGGSDRVDVPVIFVNENTLIATTTPFNATGDHDVEITFDNGQSFVSFEVLQSSLLLLHLAYRIRASSSSIPTISPTRSPLSRAPSPAAQSSTSMVPSAFFAH